MNFSAFDNIKTYSDYLIVYDALSKYLLNYENADIRENLVTPEILHMLDTFVQQNNVDRKEAIKIALDYIKSLPSLNLKISFEPSNSFIEKIYLILAQEIHEKFLLKFENDVTQFLGATIEFKGKIFNYSFTQT